MLIFLIYKIVIPFLIYKMVIFFLIYKMDRLFPYETIQCTFFLCESMHMLERLILKLSLTNLNKIKRTQMLRGA